MTANEQFTSEQVNEGSAEVDPIYLSEAYLHRDLDHDHDQDGMAIEVQKKLSLFFPKRRRKILWNLEAA